jgi:hypothetical protein
MVRAFLVTNPTIRNRWKTPEYLLLGYLLVVTASTLIYSPELSKSLPTIGLITFGLIAYYAVYMSVVSAERLQKAANIFLMVVLLNALYGIFSTFSHFALHTHFGISTNSDFGPGVFGLSYEHDIFASTCGAGAVMFFALWREPNRVMTERMAGFGFLMCTIAMFLGLSRAAWIGYGLAMIALVFLTRRVTARRVRFGRVGVILLGATVMLVVVAYLFISAQSGTQQQNSSVIGGIKAKLGVLVNIGGGTGRARTSELRTAVGDLPESPVIGLGANTYGMRHLLQKSKNNYIGDVWIRALYEAGIAGLLLLAGAVVLILWPNRTVMSSRGSLAPIARAFTFGWIVLIIAYAGTDDTLYMWPWIMLGLARVAHVLANRESQALRLGRFGARQEALDGGDPSADGAIAAGAGPLGAPGGPGVPVRRNLPRSR